VQRSRSFGSPNRIETLATQVARRQDGASRGVRGIAKRDGVEYINAGKALKMRNKSYRQEIKKSGEMRDAALF
jgi:hypothetical protein